MKNKGFTLIELIIVFAIIFIFVMLVGTPDKEPTTQELGGVQSAESFENDGRNEIECVDGVLHWQGKPISEFTCKTVE